MKKESVCHHHLIKSFEMYGLVTWPTDSLRWMFLVVLRIFINILEYSQNSYNLTSSILRRNLLGINKPTTIFQNASANLRKFECPINIVYVPEFNYRVRHRYLSNSLPMISCFSVKQEAYGNNIMRIWGNIQLIFSEKYQNSITSTNELRSFYSYANATGENVASRC